jgi:crotonobetainyl-CoA:carnitine CoA-transferase CaiB-like acyl-CoA transferase
MSSPPKFWEGLANAVGRPDMLEMDDFATRDARIANYEKVVAFLAPLFATKPRDEWCDILQEKEVPHSPMRTSQEVVDCGQAEALDLVISDPDGPHGEWRTIRSPVTFDGERQSEVKAPPVLGADNEKVLGRK